VGVKAGGVPRLCFSPPSQPFPATASAEGAQFNVPPFPVSATAEGRLVKGGPFPATVSAEGAQFNVPPFPASATAEGRLVKGGPSPARGKEKKAHTKAYVLVLSLPPRSL